MDEGVEVGDDVGLGILRKMGIEEAIPRFLGWRVADCSIALILGQQLHLFIVVLHDLYVHFVQPFLLFAQTLLQTGHFSLV